MSKLTREEFRVLRTRAEHDLAQSREVPSILICAGTGCIAGGAMKIYDNFKSECEARGLKVYVGLKHDSDEEKSLHVKMSGCHGFCEMGPLVHIEPMGIYSKKIKSLNDIPEGAKIAIPNDPSNGGRALALLQSAKLLKLKDGVGVKATVGDIVGNDKKLKIVEIEAALLPRSMDDTDLSVINSNFAMEAKLNPVKDSLFTEPKESPYANIVAVRKGDENRSEIQKLMNALRSPEVKKFIEDKYKGAVVAAF